MAFFRTGSTRSFPRWLLPTASVALFILAGSGLAFSLTFLEIDRIEGDVDGLGGEATKLTAVRDLEIAADHLLLFAAREQARGATDDGPISLNALLSASASVAAVEAAVTELETEDLRTASSLAGRAESLRIGFLSYVNTNDAASLAAFADDAEALDRAAEQAQPGLKATTRVRFRSVDSHTDHLRASLSVFGLTLVPAVLGLVVFMGVRNHRTLQVAVSRRRSIEEANATLQRRNQQFQGLYHVVTEVTETLSLKYVVETTVREARDLVDADVVTLRTLEDHLLILAGTSGGDHCHVQDDVELGSGVTGRVAKRARIMRSSPAASGEFADDTACEMSCGVVLPLIVGARVVGTISCWSAKPNAFDDDDVRVLELMASQVATAIAAADVAEERGRQAYLDPLTQLPNRRQLTQDVRFEFDSAVRRGRPIAVAMVDVDHFKDFNDTHGHHAGDIALQRVAAVLQGGLRRGDRVYRYGGEEFTIVFDSLERAAALETCERLRSLVSQARIGESADLAVTISVGLALAGARAEDFAELLLAADEALYRAKESGRDRVVIARPEERPSRSTAA